MQAVIPGGDPGRLFGLVERFEDYPGIVANCRAVQVKSREGDVLISSWEVNFRNGILKWEERDVIDREGLRIEFAQTEGDLAMFWGEWEVQARAGGAGVRFMAEFDLGIPSLASMLHPVAERTLTANVVEIIRAFGAAAGTPVSEIETQESLGESLSPSAA